MYIYRYLIACVVIMALTLLSQVHIIQLNSYNLDQQLLWYKKNKVSFVMNLVMLISAILYYELHFIPAYFVVIISIFGLLIENLPRKQKKKLVYTKRVIRLIFLCSVFFILTLIPALVYKNEFGLKYAMYGLALSPLIVFIAYLILLPIENGFRRNFMNEAKNIIDRNTDLYTIGITGSFGKTSVKHYVDRLLKIKYSTCMTPESFNTAMGATLTIKNELRNINEIFVCEMGARRVGDIKEICNIVSPYGCIITDVGNMHLDTFKTIDNVLKTKFELVDSMSHKDIIIDKWGEGIILLNGDNGLIREEAESYNFTNKKVYFYGLNPDNDFYAANISGGSDGTTFYFKSTINDFDEIKIKTRLLGNYNVVNLVAAISYALLLKVRKEDIIKEVENIETVAHRLQLLSYDKDNLIIDDAYNSNPKGARNAIDVLKTFDGYKKIIITPGMVELNDKQDLENEDFAKYAGEVVDYAIVVGHTNKIPLKNGFEKSMTDEKVICIDKVEDAISFVRESIEGKKVILLENDLSDNY